MHAYINRIKGLTFLLLLLFVVNSGGLKAQATTTGELDIEGTIVESATNNPVSGASVSVEGFSSVLTKDDGTFTLKVADYNVTLQVKSQGYQYTEIPLKGKSKVLIKLYEESYNSFYDATYTPYNQSYLSKTTGAVSSADVSGVWKSTDISVDEYMKGRIAGLSVKSRSGMPGQGDNIYLRGYSSLLCTSQPTFVIDGVLYDTKTLGTSLFNNSTTNPLSFIDVKDIDNITVIKDASASFYGIRSANGVIVINTKHAAEATTHIDFSCYGGLNQKPEERSMMDAYDYRRYLSDIIQSKPGFTSGMFNTLAYMNDNINNSDYYTYHNNTNWQKEVFKNSSSQNYFLRVTGGDAYARYSLSVGYLDHSNVVKGSEFSRYTTRFNSDINFSPKLTVNANFSLAYNSVNSFDDGVSGTNPVYLSLIKAPFLKTHAVTSSGYVSPSLADYDIFNVSNPSAIISDYLGESKNYHFTGTIKANYQLSKRLTVSSLIALDYEKIRERESVPGYGVVPDTLVTGQIKSLKDARSDKKMSIYSDSKLNYSIANRIHNLDASVGFRFNPITAENIVVSQYSNKDNDNYLNVGYGSSDVGYRNIDGNIGNYTEIAFYSSINYGFLNRYFLSYNMSIDGSSKFGKNAEDGIALFSNKFAVLPSLGASWLISSEKFMKNLNCIDLLKIRASYGLTANEDIGIYSSQNYYSSVYTNGSYGLELSNLGADNLQWEKVTKTNLGVDLGLFNERFMISFDLYKNTTDKMLTYAPAPIVSGYDYMLTNAGKMENKGMEIMVNSRILNGKVKWDLGFTLAKYKNKVLTYPDNQYTTSVYDANIITKAGQPLGLFYGYKTNGVYATDAAAQADGFSTSASGISTAFSGGDVKFTDTNNDKTIDAKDMQVIGNPNPDFTGSISTRLNYKRITFDALFTFSYGNDVFNYQRYQLESMKGYSNQTLAVRNRWQNQGDVTNMPKATWGDPMGNSRFSDRWIEDGSFIRLKTLSLSYNLPVNPKFIKSATVFISGSNLFTLTKYLGWDPEFSSQTRPLTQGIDLGMQPQFTSLFLGFKVGL